MTKPAETIGLDEVVGWPHPPAEPRAPFLLAGGDVTWSERIAITFPTRDNGRLSENLPRSMRRGMRVSGSEVRSQARAGGLVALLER